MQQILPKPGELKSSTLWWWLGLMFFIVLAVFQDYLFSQFQNTGFYLSESLLYNSIWLFLLPLTILEFILLDKIVGEYQESVIITTSGLSILLCILHISLFVTFFVAISSLIFTPPHSFGVIFKSVMSGQFYLILIYYLAAPFIRAFVHKRQDKSKNSAIEFVEHIKIKTGAKTTVLPIMEIQCISTDKPYSVVYANGRSFLDDRTLKEFEVLLNPNQFLRVHRSSIVHISYIKELKSRQNGDYDVELRDGMMVRMSRHYKKNWEALLH